tara:strand:- start:550 stop:3069 length:2520 start_codon:yes stop_codon:yes gene_type:complete
MPRQSLQLNDFSGGLNTKSSARDIAPNELQQADNAIISNPGLIQSSSTTSEKIGATSKNNTNGEGTGAFIFNHEYDITDTDTFDQGETVGTGTKAAQTAKEIIAYPDNTTIEFFHRNFDNSEPVTTGNFSDAGTANAITLSDGNCQPVYYYVDGVLYIADRKRVDTSASFTQKALQLINTKRFGTVIEEWASGDAAVTTTTDAIFEAVETDSSVTTPATAGEFRIGFDTTPTQTSLSNIQISSSNIRTCASPIAAEADSIGASDEFFFVEDSDESGTANIMALTSGDLSPGNLIYLDDEIMKVVSAIGASTTSASLNYILKVTVLRGMFDTVATAHSLNTVLEKSSDAPISGGAWEEGVYEFTYTLINQTQDETLPHKFSTPLADATIAAGKFFSDIDVKINIEDVFRKREKGFRVYTRIKDSNDRWVLFLDADYERGVRTNLFDDYSDWVLGGDTYGDGGTDSFATVEGLQSKIPSFDTYESNSGYSQTEKSISLGTKGGYKAATVCSRRAWIANVRKDDVVYDDRIYFTPVNRFATFPDSYYLDIGISDGDSFTALHSLGNRLMAFKQNKLYIVNVSSSSDAGWYLEAEYDGMGCQYQETVTKTPFGICWVNSDGVFIFDGQSMPKELTGKLNDKTWRTNSSDNPAIGYNSKHKQLCVVQNTTATDDVLVYDFATASWAVNKSMSNGMSNFFSTSEGIYFIEYASSGHNKTIELFTGDPGLNQLTVITKDIDFGNPGLVKRIKKVYVTVHDGNAAGSTTNNTLTLNYKVNNPGGAVDSTTTEGATAIGSAAFDVKPFTVNANCQSIQLKLIGASSSAKALTISDVNIDYRLTNKRPS